MLNNCMGSTALISLRRLILMAGLLAMHAITLGQDSSVTVNHKVVILKEVVVRNNMNVPDFIRRVQDDTTFYKAFRNLRVLGYSAINDIRMMNKSGEILGSLESKTIQKIGNGCRWMDVLDERSSGDIYTSTREFNYYTAQMYAGLFFAKDTICGETNSVAGNQFNTKGKSGLSKHKEQLKMLFFNPGKPIPGIPFIGNKIALFDEEVAGLYDFLIDMESFKGENCYVFRQTPREDLTRSQAKDIVINEMVTWFNPDTWEIVARRYDLSYNTGVYDFDVRVEVEMTKFGNLLVPKLLKYNGNWDVAFKKRERGVFTATLFDFTH